MLILILGLLLFLGVHSLPIAARDLRGRFLERHGEPRWKGLFSALAVVGLVLIVWGYGLTRVEPVFVWNPPLWTRHLALLLNLVAVVLIAAAYVPRNHFKQRLGHPMYAGVKLWAFAHLLANGRLGDIVLFGAFLVWAVIGFASARRRDRASGVIHPPGTAGGTLATLAAGTLLWVALVFWLHALLIGVAPL